MIEKIKNMPEWAFVTLFLGSMFLYKAIIGLQGLDVYDDGWVLSAYQQIFNDPTTCSYHFLYYNALPIGGLWNILFGSWGIYGFRILSALCSVSIAYVVYILLRREINRWCIFAGIMLFNLGYIMVFHHNGLTALLVVLASLFLYKGLITSNKWWMLLAGIVVGINIFTRIPNVSMFALSLVFIPYYIYTRDSHQTFCLLGMACLGVIAGVGCELLIMYSFGQLDIFIDSLFFGLSTSSSSDSTHSLSKLLVGYVQDYVIIFQQLTLLLSIPSLVYFLHKFISNIRIRHIISVIAIPSYFVLICKELDIVYMIYAICYLMFCIYAIKCPKNKSKIYLITIALIILFFLPFGSDYGIVNMGINCVWIAAPLSIGLIYDMLRKYNNNTFKLAPTYLIVCMAAIIVTSLFDVSLNCHFDHGSRLKKIIRPQVFLANTYTTASRAYEINTLMDNLQPLVTNNDYLLCYPSFPIANYLTKTRPYLGTSWPWVYDANCLESQFIKTQENIKELPIILRNKSKIGLWYQYDPDWDNIESIDQWNYNTKKMELIKSFIDKYHYYVVWENELFQILKPGFDKVD